MTAPHSRDLDRNIARARLILAPATLLSIYVDAAKPDLAPWFGLTGGPLTIDPYALVVLLCHFAYSSILRVWVTRHAVDRRFVAGTTALDVVFAIAVAVFTEGPTSPSYGFFTFAIIAVGCRQGFRETLVVTALSMVAYLTLMLLSEYAGRPPYYVMRPVYLGITGYLIGFLGQQRINFETRVRELETAEERRSIARSLHDGYLQALAAVNLRLGGCRQLLEKGETSAALDELGELRIGVAREYDEVRSYVRSLSELEDSSPAETVPIETEFHVRTDFRVRGLLAEQILLVVLEAIRNTLRHARAETARIDATGEAGGVRIAIVDDGIGFATESSPPWSIASRVAEVGGKMRIVERLTHGAHLEIELPAR